MLRCRAADPVIHIAIAPCKNGIVILVLAAYSVASCYLDGARTGKSSGGRRKYLSHTQTEDGQQQQPRQQTKAN